MVTDRNYTIWWFNMYKGWKITEKAQVPAWVLTLEKDNKWKPDERNTLELDVRESMENRYEGFSEERVW